MSPSPTPLPLPPEPSSSTYSHPQFAAASSHLDTASIMDTAMLPPRISSPEPFEYSELESLRVRMQEYALSPNATEAELAALVLRLASQLLLHPSPAQLASQAETIARLAFQRDMLLQERLAESERWQSERESWDRIAETLASKARIAQEPITKDQEVQRYIARLEDDLKTSRRRLSDTQARLSTLESELSRLRPLLSMQATILRDPELWRSEHLSSLVTERLATYAKRWKGKERASHPDDDAAPTPSTGRVVQDIGSAASEAADNHEPVSVKEQRVDEGTRQPAPTDMPPPSPFHAASKSHSKREKSHRHRRERDQDRDKDRRHRHRNARGTPLLADARAECILVAARKIGRIRAGIVSGLVQERAQLEREADLIAQNVQNAESTQPDRHVLNPPFATQPRPSVTNEPTRAGDRDRTTPELDAGSSSPAVPLAASYQAQGSSTRGGAPSSSQRRLAPSPFPVPGPGVSYARQPPMPTHLHPSTQVFTPAAQGRHPHTISHPGYMYFAAGPGQSGPVSYMVPVPWGVPGTPAVPTAGPSQPARTDAQRTQETPKTRTPARRQTDKRGQGSSTPMDSLVSAARTLIEDEDYDGEEERRGADETPVTRRGTRRRAAGIAPESPVPKRRRMGGTTDDLSASTSVAGPSGTRSARRGKAAALPPAQETSKPRGRAKGKGKEKAAPASHTAAPAALDPPGATSSTTGQGRVPHAPQVTRIRSALDVLADQAAQEQERRPSLDPASRRASASEGRDEEEATLPLSPVQEADDSAGDVFVVERAGAVDDDAQREDTEVEPENEDTEPTTTEDQRPSGDHAIASISSREEEVDGATHAPPKPPGRASPPPPPPPPFSSPLLPLPSSAAELPGPANQDQVPRRTRGSLPNVEAAHQGAAVTSGADPSLDVQPAEPPTRPRQPASSTEFEVEGVPSPPSHPPIDTLTAQLTSRPHAEVEIESGDEDAEGSVVEDEEQ
ncbi:hypothetical protein ACG7TL_004157 [Trametes sanguinea]